jgi:protein-tyrosine phosphatase
MLRVVCVCTGNVCRSPQAEQLLRAGLGPALHGEVEISSAGTAAATGAPMTEPAAAWSRALGGDPATHRSRYLTPRVLRDADLVLGMAREHRREVVGLAPALTKTTFTLRELARLAATVDADELVAAAEAAGSDPSARLRALLGLLGRRRGTVPPPTDPAADDVVDPIGRAPEVYEQSARQVEDALPPVLRLLRLATRSTRA